MCKSKPVSMRFKLSKSRSISFILRFQDLPPGCRPPPPTLLSIFGKEIDEEELATAVDGAEHLETSQASRRLTALSSALPNELASHIQVNMHWYLSIIFQKCRTKFDESE